MTGQEAELARRLRDGAKTLCEMLMQEPAPPHWAVELARDCEEAATHLSRARAEAVEKSRITPRAGVRIETLRARITPRAGVRIETLRANQRGEISRNRATRDAGQSLLAQECGLKLRGDSTGR